MTDNEDRKNDVVDDEGDLEEVPLSQKTSNDTPESYSVQEEEQPLVNSDSSAQKNHGSSDAEPGQNPPDLEEQSEKNRPNIHEVLENIDLHAAGLRRNLIWKEKLKLLYLDAVIPETYYDLWREEADDWFRRSVILKARRVRLKKRGSRRT